MSRCAQWGYGVGKAARTIGLATGLCCALWSVGCAARSASEQAEPTPSEKIRVFLAAADYRHAIDTAQRQVADRPSAFSYVVLTYVYQALDAYLESLALADRWVGIELLAASLLSGKPDELLDASDVLPRIAKELIQSSVRRQSDIAAAMATRVDESTTGALWGQQRTWRERHPNSWWLGMPDQWGGAAAHLTP
ncbi:MAG: hypothetical protein U0412_01850 [Nitrospira sp.]